MTSVAKLHVVGVNREYETDRVRGGGIASTLLTPYPMLIAHRVRT